MTHKSGFLPSSPRGRGEKASLPETFISTSGRFDGVWNPHSCSPPHPEEQRIHICIDLELECHLTVLLRCGRDESDASNSPTLAVARSHSHRRPSTGSLLCAFCSRKRLKNLLCIGNCTAMCQSRIRSGVKLPRLRCECRQNFNNFNDHNSWLF